MQMPHDARDLHEFAFFSISAALAGDRGSSLNRPREIEAGLQFLVVFFREAEGGDELED
jgi:hypothetical protein